jgi:LysR family transcriptional regulator, glycine cleavage system transcriptional activator
MSRSRLPPLPALRAFEAVARRASFKQAADELAVTPTAISHQIRQLETYLGRRVLDRTPRSVTLTTEGAALYEVTRAGFEAIAEVVGRIREGAGAPRITLSSTAAFLGHWLPSRLDALRRDLPAIDLRLHASDAVVDLRAGGIEAAIRYGKGPFVNGAALCSDSFAPVCSPKLGIKTLADLRRATLIHIDGRRRPQLLPDWRRWCEKAKARQIDTDSGQHLPDSLLAVQAAIAGQGVAIVSRVLVSDALRTGLLVAPFSVALPGDAYHFVCAEGLEHRADIASLRNWFASELADEPHSLARR